MAAQIKCPKCDRPMHKDNRASDKKREVWICPYKDCQHHVIIPIMCKICNLEKRVVELEKHVQQETRNLREHGCHPNCPHLHSCGPFSPTRICKY